MKKNYLKLLSFSSFLIFSNLFQPIIHLQAKEIENEVKVDLNYLKKVDQDNYYILGVGDKLNIIISREIPELNSKVTIDGGGTIFLPRLKRIFVKGLTITELNSLLNEAYEEYILFPNVEIMVEDYRPINIIVKGEVNRPRNHIMPGSIKTSNNYFPTVFDAISESKGITEYSDLSRVEILRRENLTNGGGFKKTTLDFTNRSNPEIFNQNIRIYSGDIITIPRSSSPNENLIYDVLRKTLNPEYLEIIVAGRVESPGTIKLPLNTSLNDAIQASGGLRVLPGSIKIARFKKDATLETLKVKFNQKAKRGTKNNPLLEQGDIIFVEKSAINKSSEFINEISSPFTGLFSTYGLFKALQD